MTLRTKIEEAIDQRQVHLISNKELADQICTIFKEELEKIKTIEISPVSVREYELIEAIKMAIFDSLINSLEEGKTVREICPATKKPVEECLCSSCSQYRERRNKLLGD